MDRNIRRDSKLPKDLARQAQPTSYHNNNHPGNTVDNWRCLYTGEKHPHTTICFSKNLFGTSGRLCQTGTKLLVLQLNYQRNV